MKFTKKNRPPKQPQHQEINVKRETRLAVRQIVVLLESGESEKACTAMDLLNEMLDSVNAGQPKPWSWYQDRLTA